MAEMAEITENERDNESDTERDTERAKALQQGKFKLRAAGFFLRANAGFRKKLFEHLGPNDEAPPPLQLSMYDFVWLYDFFRDQFLRLCFAELVNF